MNSGVDNLNVIKNILQNSKELNGEWKDFSVDKIIKMIDLAKKIENTESLSEKNQLRTQFNDVAGFYYKDLKQILKEEKKATKQLKKDEQWNRGKPNDKRILLRRKEHNFSKERLIYNELYRAIKEKISPNEELSDELKATLNILSQKLVNSGLSFENVKENIIGDESHGIIYVLDQLNVYRDTFDHNNNEALLHVLTNINDYFSIGNKSQEKENKTESLDQIKKDNKFAITASVIASCALFCGVTLLVVHFHQLAQQMRLQALQQQAQNETRDTTVIVNQNYDNLNLNNNPDLLIVEGNNLNNNDDILNINNINNNNNINNMPG